MLSSRRHYHQVVVRGLDGRSLVFSHSAPTISGGEIFKLVVERCNIPYNSLRLQTGTRAVSESENLHADASSGLFPTCQILVRLRGGKGGFGSLLRGNTSKAGQKKTTNFDACRDMSGRRLRHVNSEKKLEEWARESKERELEKKAQDYIKELAKSKREEQKYDRTLNEFRDLSEKAMESVESSVNYGMEVAKRRTIALGKRKLSPSKGERESEQEEEEEDAVEKIGALLRKQKKGKASEYLLGTILDYEESESSEEEVENEEGGESAGEEDDQEESSQEEGSSSSDHSSHSVELSNNSMLANSSGEENDKTESSPNGEKSTERVPEQFLNAPSALPLKPAVVENSNSAEPGVGPSISPSIERERVPEMARISEVSNSPSKEEASAKLPQGCDDRETATAEQTKIPPPLFLNESGEIDFEKVKCASDLESLGLDRLKAELSLRGLKCGGQLSERAGRLFLLKHTPLDKIEPRHLASGTASGSSARKNKKK